MQILKIKLPHFRITRCYQTHNFISYLFICICIFFFFLKQCGNCVTIYISLKVNCRCFPEGLQPHQVATLAQSIKIYGTNPNNVTLTILCDFQTSKYGWFSRGSPSNWHCWVNCGTTQTKWKEMFFFFSIYVLCLHSACGIAHFVSALQIYSTGEDRR